MKKVLCFIDKEQNFKDDIKEFIELLDNSGFEVYLYMDTNNQVNNPSDILYTLDTVIDKEEKAQYTFLSNICNLTKVIYRIYHQLFHHFIYLDQESADSYNLSGVYQEIFNLRISEIESLYKPIFTNVSHFNINGSPIDVMDYFLYINDINQTISLQENKDIAIINNSCSADLSSTLINKTSPLIRKYYFINGYYHLFEPVLADKSVVIREKQNVTRDGDYTFHYPGFSRMQYMYTYNTEVVRYLLSLLEALSYKSMNEIYDLLEQMEKDMSGYYEYIFNMSCCVLEDAAINHNGKDILKALLIQSFLMQVTKKPKYLNRFLELSLHSNVLSCENRFFLWNQAKRYVLISRVNTNSDSSRLIKELYEKAYKEYLELLNGNLPPIPLEERDPNTIVVFTIQFLSERHAPTRTTLERCYTLSKLLGKKILLINTREQLTRKGMLLLYQPTLGNVMEEYNTISEYQYKDCAIPYYQPSDNMPSVDGIRLIINKIREIKPSFIFSIGNGSITADLCGKMVPQAAIGVAFSTLPTTMATFSVIGKRLSDKEWEKYIGEGYQKESIIESTFTFELIPKKKHFTREEFGIPVNSFLLVTVGIRLDMEIDDAFIETIIKTFSWGTHIVFAGYFDKYKSFCEKYPDFEKHSTFIGYCDDMLALMEICDLYVNPNRLGGGFSIIEAFHEGKPGVTINSGDISIAAGELFTVKDYLEMTEIIRKYMVDNEFYQTMSDKALERERQVTDSGKAMADMVFKIQSSRLFF